MRLRPTTLLMALLCSFWVSYAQNQPSDTLKKNAPLRVYHTIRLTTAKPVIDGILNDPCWQTGEWSGDYTQWIPNEGAKPTQDTKVKILYDDKNLYVALRGFDTEPSKISRKAGRRDELTGDLMGITFDSYHDHRTGFEFSVTAAGQKIDLILTNPMNADFNWNAVWYMKTGLEDSAWVAEYEIPLSQLRYSKADEQVWGLHVWRWIDRLSEESDWEVQSLTGPGALYLFGELRGIKGLPKSKRIEIMPYEVARFKTFQKDPANPFAYNGRSWLASVGLDAKIGLSSNFTADLTVNPDFGQVESDPSVMNLTAFETFYEEKRPFFLEGKNIFEFDLGDAGLFYSRRIGHTPATPPTLGDINYQKFPENTSILSAVKISGKSADGMALGVLHSLTDGEKAQINSAGNTRDLRVEPLTSYTVARVQQDFKQGNTVLGGILTSTNRFIEDPYLEFMNRHAFTGGMDFMHQWHDKEFFLDAKLIGSSLKGSPDAISRLQLSPARYYQRSDVDHLHFDSTRTQLSGHGGRIKIGKGSKGLLRYSAEIDWKSPGLDLNDIGFMQLADIVEQETEVSYFVNKPVSIFRTYTLGVHQTNQWDYKMNYQHSGVYLFAFMDFLNRWNFSPNVSYRTESLDTRLLRGGNAILMPAGWDGSLHMHTDNSKKLFFSINSSFAAADNDHYRSSEHQASATVIPLNVLKISLRLNYSENKDNLQYVGTMEGSHQDKYLMARIDQQTVGATFRIDYNITPELSIQYYASPFASTGKYSAFKEITNPGADNYNDRFEGVNPQLAEGNEYQVMKPGGMLDYKFENPDFTFTQFRSNLVFRWEYRPGSQLFLVWGNERTDYKKQTTRYVENALGQFKHAVPSNIFQVKLNYWFSL